MLNEFFCSCFNTAFPPLTPMCNQPSSHTEESLLCTEDEVCHLLLTLDTTKSSGPDGISTAMLKHTADTIAPSLTKIFNLSLHLGQLPSQWKHSLIVPIPKSSTMGSPSCYRPISLLPIVSKILERHICDILLDHLQSLNFISSNQWGFQEGRSTITAIIKCTDDWLKELEVGRGVCAIFFDFRKAFDSVPHEPLLCKLSTLNLDDCMASRLPLQPNASSCCRWRRIGKLTCPVWSPTGVCAWTNSVPYLHQRPNKCGCSPKFSCQYVC